MRKPIYFPTTIKAIILKKATKMILIASTIAISIPSCTLWQHLGRAPSAEQIMARVPAVQFKDNALQNEIDTPTLTGDISRISMIREAISPSNPNLRPNSTIPSIKSGLTQLAQKDSSIVWFGHSSYLLTIDGTTILVDPVLSGHASPFSWLLKSFDGTDIFTVDDLPAIDILLISHDHYDHLDYETVLKLKSKVKHIVVPLGVGEHFKFWGFDEKLITELNWHDTTKINDISITATPARHFSGRGLQRNKTLWASFVVKNPNSTVYVGGDSGYGPHFKAIGTRYGPFDLVMLDNGQYNENWRFIHMMPDETVQAAKDLNAKVLFPVHSGKFTLARHDWDEPLRRVSAEANEQKQALMTPIIGQIGYLNQSVEINQWWLSLKVK